MPQPRPGMIALGAAAAAWVDPPLVSREVRYLMNHNPELDPNDAANAVVSARSMLTILGMPLFLAMLGGLFALFGGLAEFLPATAKFMVGEGPGPFVFAAPAAITLLGVILLWVPIGIIRGIWWRRARACGAPWEIVTSPWDPRLWGRRTPPFKLSAFDTPEQMAEVRARKLFLGAFVGFFVMMPVFGGVVYFFECLGKALTILGIG